MAGNFPAFLFCAQRCHVEWLSIGAVELASKQVVEFREGIHGFILWGGHFPIVDGWLGDLSPMVVPLSITALVSLTVSVFLSMELEW